MGDTNLNLSDIKIKNANTGQETKINDFLKFNVDNKNLFDFGKLVYSSENYMKIGDISLTGEPYQQNTILTDHTVTNAAYDIWKTANDMKKEDKDMKVLDIYEEREREYINDNFKITKEELIKNDPFVKLHDKYVKDIEKLYKKEYDRELEYKSVLGTEFLLKETKEAIEKADEQKVFELENLDELLVEVKAMLDMTNDYDKKIEILKKYQILNEEGMINA